MVKIDVIQTGNPKTLKSDIEKWLQSHPTAKIQQMSHLTAAGSLWTTMLYEE